MQLVWCPWLGMGSVAISGSIVEAGNLLERLDETCVEMRSILREHGRSLKSCWSSRWSSCAWRKPTEMLKTPIIWRKSTSSMRQSFFGSLSLKQKAPRFPWAGLGRRHPETERLPHQIRLSMTKVNDLSRLCLRRALIASNAACSSRREQACKSSCHQYSSLRQTYNYLAGPCRALTSSSSTLPRFTPAKALAPLLDRPNHVPQESR